MINFNNEQNRKPKIEYLPLALTSLIIFAVSISLFYISKEYAYHKQTFGNDARSIKGEGDFRDVDFDERIEFIFGEVEYVCGALLSPDEFASYTGEIKLGYVPSDAKAATARMRLLVPPGRYMLSGDSIDYNDRIYINNERRLDVGSPGLTKEESIAGARYIKLEIEAPEGIIEIVRQSSNFVHKENTGYDGFWLSTPENINQMVSLQEMSAGIIAGMYLALFLMHLIIWLLFRVYRPNIWFSLLCLAGFFNEGFIGRKIFWSMFPGLPWNAAYKLSCTAITLTGTLILLLINDEFPGLMHKHMPKIFAAVSAAITIFFLAADTVLISRTVEIAEIIFVLATVYTLIRFIWMLKKKEWRNRLRIEHILIIFGIAVALAAFLHDAAYYRDIHLFSYEITDVGTMVFVLFQMAGMFHATMRQYSNARQEAAESKRKVEELAAKTDFYHRIAHELLTPLTRVSTNVQTAMGRPEEAKKLLADSQSEIMDMAEMINSALDERED